MELQVKEEPNAAKAPDQSETHSQSQDETQPTSTTSPSESLPTKTIDNSSSQPPLSSSKSSTGKSRSPIKKSNSRRHASGRKMTVSLSKMQKNQVDAVFEDLYGYKWGASPLIEESVNDECARLLKRIFGAKEAAQVLYQCQRHGASTSTVSIRFGSKAAVQNMSYAPTGVSPQISKAKPSVTEFNASASSISTKTARLDTSSVQTRNPAPASGADAVLQQMQGKKQTSTIMKTAMDWESFKDQSGTLGEKLEQHAESKGAYLKRQDFLTRVDHRQFEQERDERERNRAKKI